MIRTIAACVALYVAATSLAGCAMDARSTGECFDGSTGQPTESMFDLAFDTRSPENTPSFTYAWANDPSASSYQPAPEWEFGSLNSGCGVQVAQSNVTITRAWTGSYSVQFPGMASADSNGPFNVKVTGYGGGSDTCEVSDLRPWGTSGWASVYCFDARGAAVDAFFTITFSSFAYVVC